MSDADEIQAEFTNDPTGIKYQAILAALPAEARVDAGWDLICIAPHAIDIHAPDVDPVTGGCIWCRSTSIATGRARRVDILNNRGTREDTAAALTALGWV